MITTSRSAVATRKLCPMKRYWAYHALHPQVPVEAQRGGLTPVVSANGSATQRGTLIHALLEAGMRGQDLDEAFQEACPPDMPQEQAVLARRAAKGWMRVRGQSLRAAYRPVSTEEEWLWAMSPMVTQQLRMDVVLRHAATGGLLILDYKTMATMDRTWEMRMLASDQTHLYIQALTERTEELVQMQYEAIIVGRKDQDMQKSPFVSAYPIGDMWVPHYQKGRSRASTLHWSDDEWLEWADTHALWSELYATTGPLRPTNAQLLATKNATAHAELQWANTLAQLEEVADNPELLAWRRESLIERNSESCAKFGMGYICAYSGLCWEGHQVDEENFVPRVDHHLTEQRATGSVDAVEETS